MQQLSIDDFANNEQEQEQRLSYVEQIRRLVPKDYMTSLEWRIYDYLTKNCLTYKQRINMADLAELFGITEREVRFAIETIKLKQVAKLGNVNGYYIMSKDEYQKELSSAKARLEKQVEVFLRRFPEQKEFLFKKIHQTKSEWLAQGQSQFQFTGHEKIFIRQFAEDYR